MTSPLRVAFAGVFASHVIDRVRARLRVPCEVIAGDEREILPRLGDVDVLVGMGFTREMAEAAPRLRLVQVPGAGLDRIDRGALGPGTALANAYGHDVGIAEYVIGAMLAVARDFCRVDADLRRGQWIICGASSNRNKYWRGQGAGRHKVHATASWVASGSCGCAVGSTRRKSRTGAAAAAAGWPSGAAAWVSPASSWCSC